MFTGIIRQISKIINLTHQSGRARIAVDLGALAADISRGDSVAINGVCLTLSSKSGNTCEFDVVSETLSRTTLGSFRPGDSVNIEPSLRVGDQVGGHFVMGHVDAVGTLLDVRVAGEPGLKVKVDSPIAAQMVPKGSVAIDGVSLTIVDVGSDWFTCAIIPTTLSDTTLGAKSRGAALNIETDIFGKYAAKYLGKQGGGVTIDKLRDAGFV